MKTTIPVIVFVLISGSIIAQSITLPPSGDNQKSSVTQWIGLASVTITYNSPNVTGPNGEDRKGHIWGELVPYGFTDPGYGTSTSAPWRVGANENTTITFSHDMRVNEKEIKAGTYGLFLVVEKDGPWTWIFSKDAGNWGHYHYDPRNDALRVTATPKDAPFTEWLTFNFDDRLRTSAVAYLQWENKRVDFKIDFPGFYDAYVNQIRDELQGHRMGFSNQSWIDAAMFCATNKVNLEEALEWAEYAISGRYIGVEDFNSLQAKAVVLTAMGKETDAEAIMAKAINLPSATVQAVHQYGRSLLASGKTEKALEVFKLNQKKYPGEKFTTNVGLARAYTALGDKKNAIKHWELALKNIPENQKANLAFYEGELKKLKG
jgi:Uncharacterized protein conserved in bacteria